MNFHENQRLSMRFQEKEERIINSIIHIDLLQDIVRKRILKKQIRELLDIED